MEGSGRIEHEGDMNEDAVKQLQSIVDELYREANLVGRNPTGLPLHDGGYLYATDSSALRQWAERLTEVARELNQESQTVAKSTRGTP